MSKKKPDTGAQSEKAERKAIQEAQKKRQQRLTMLTGGIIIAIVVVAVGITVMQNSQTEEDIFTRELDDNVDLRLEGQPRLGSEHAPVTVVEFADFSCSHCKTFHEEKLSRLERDYINIGSVQFYFINFPALGASSQFAAEAAECMFTANPSLFWDVHDALFAAQFRILDSINNNTTTAQVRESIENVLREDLPTDPSISDAIACLQDGEATAEVAADFASGQQSGIRGTPSVFVNNTLVDITGDNLFTYIDQELEKSQ